MRKITVNRKKSLIGCAGTVLIYTIDKIQFDKIIKEGEEITKDQCVFVGSIKNGSDLKFEITYNEIVILSAYDNLCLFWVHSAIIIPEGKEEIILNGKVKFNPAHGNPFVFE